MNRRQFLAGAGTAVVGAAGGYGGLRVADIRPYDPELPTGDSPRERIIAAAEHRHAADHRAITRVRVLDDWTGEAPYDLDVFRRWYQHSRRRQLRALTTYTAPLARSHPIHDELAVNEMFPHESPFETTHSARVLGDTEELPLTTVLHITDGKIIFDRDAPTPEDDKVRVSDAYAYHYSQDYPPELSLIDFIRPHQTEWRRTDESAGTITYRVSGPDPYVRVVPLPPRTLEVDDCWIEVTLGRETGRLRRIVDHRDLNINVEEAAGQSLTFRIETEFDQYGDTTARRPAGNIEQDLETRLNGLGYDLLTY